MMNYSTLLNLKWGLKPPCLPHQQRPPQVDASLYGDVIGGLQESPLKHQSQEEQHGQHRGVLQQLVRGHEVHAEVALLLRRLTRARTHTHTDRNTKCLRTRILTIK